MDKIGIIMQNEIMHNKRYVTIKEELINKLSNYNIGIIGIPKNIPFKCIIELIKECRGVILPGGDKYTKIDLKIAKYLYNNNIPTLGICQGMQVMGIANNGILKIKSLNNHYSNLKNHHDITINQNSILYQIFNKKTISVNSRHFDELVSTKLHIAAISSNDHIIEAIDDLNKKFYLGVQWHPESLNNKESRKLLEYFIAKCLC